MARALRSSKRRWLLRRMTLKRSKSVRPFLLAKAARFLAQLVSFHLSSISAFSHAFLTAARREPRIRPGMTRGERRALDRGRACRGTARLSSEEGPSTRTYRETPSCQYTIQPGKLPMLISRSRKRIVHHIHACGR